MNESKYMPASCSAWFDGRATQLPKKGAKRDLDQAAYMQGVLSCATASGMMSMDRASQIHFMAAVGRLDEFMQQQAQEWRDAQAAEPDA